MDERIKAALLTAMRELDIGYVVGRGSKRFCAAKHRSCRNVKKLRNWVDKTANQPRAGDAVYLGPFACDPFRRRVESRRNAKVGLPPDCRRAAFPPRLNATLQVMCIQSGGAQSDTGVLADLVAVYAIDDDVGLMWQEFNPLVRCERVAPGGTGQHDGVGLKCGGTTYVDQQRRRGTAA